MVGPTQNNASGSGQASTGVVSSTTGEKQALRTHPGHVQALLMRNRALRKEVKSTLLEPEEATDDPFAMRPEVEDSIKRRKTAVQTLRAKIKSETDGVDHFIFQVREVIEELKLAFMKTQTAFRIAEARSEMRTKRPPQENAEDALHEALEEEQRILIEVLHLLSDKIQSGEDLITPLQDIRFDMHQSRLNLHLDRSGRPQELLDKLARMEKTAMEFCREAAKTIEGSVRRTERAGSRTQLKMQQQIACLSDEKAQLENDLKETKSTMRATQAHLEKTRRQLERSMPEKIVSDECDIPKKKHAKQQLSAHLMELRQKVKAAAYNGFNGCQIDVVFNRFDRDGSGELDVEEVRRSFRRACRIPPSLVSDADIACLCTLLDHDKSGSININEIVELLTADEDVSMLEDRCRRAEDFLEKLRTAQQESLADFRSKLEALKIDIECSKVTTARGLLKLENPSCRSRPGTSPRMPAVGPPATLSPLCDTLPERPSTTSMAHRTYLPSTARPLTSSSASASRRLGAQQRALTDRTERSELPKLDSAAKKLDTQTLDQIRSKIKAAAYTGTAGCQLDVIFSRFDKDGSRQLSGEELRVAVRRALRIPPSSISDVNISSFFDAIDTDSTGSVSVDELVAFVGSEAPSRTTK